MDKRKRILAAVGAFVLGLALERVAVPAYLAPALFIAAWGISGFDVLLQAARNVKGAFLLGEHFLMSTATVGAILIGEYPEAAMVMILYQIGEAIQDAAVGKSRRSIAELMDIVAPIAHRITEGRSEDIAPEEIEIGDIIEIRSGERVPVDGCIERGESSVDVSALTGESMPLSVQPGAILLSGSINGTGRLVLIAQKRVEDSTAGRILSLLEEASENQARSESLITRFARIYTPIVVGAALLLALFLPLFFRDVGISEGIRRGLTFLVVSCPCAFIISVPMAFFSGIGVSSRAGVLVKGGNVLEQLARMNVLGLDKTGTLTEGRFEVVYLHPEPISSEEEMIQMAAAMESGSSHPIAEAIRACRMERFSSSRGDEEPASVISIPGRGLTAEIDGAAYILGNRTHMSDFGLAEEAGQDGCDENTAATMVHIAQIAPIRRYLGHFVIRDRIKPQAKEAIEQIRALSVRHIAMLTGDGGTVSTEVAERVGVDAVHFGLLPQEKLAWVRAWKEQHPKDTVGFVGDGLNDAPVLALSDVGFAMGGIGSDAAIEAADVVLMADDLNAIGSGIRIARRTVRIAKENIFFSLGIKLLFLLCSALGWTNMWMAVFADTGVSLLAVANCLRLFHAAPRRASGDI